MAKRVSKENLIEHTSFMFDNTNVLKRNTLYTYESTVNKGQIVLKCTTQGTTANTTLDLSSVSVGDLLSDGTAEWEVISVTGYGIGSGGSSSGSGLEDWKPNHLYKENDLFVYEHQIYKALVGFTSGNTFGQIDILEDYTLAGETPILWAEGVEITTNDIVEYDGNYYKALIDFTCGKEFTKTAFEEYVPKSLTDEEVEEVIDSYNPEFSGGTGGGIDLPEWEQNTEYKAGTYLVYGGTIYKVINDFTSGTTFDDTDLEPYVSPIMKGATSSANGEAGMVPESTTADINKFLCADGTWKTAVGIGNNPVPLGTIIQFMGITPPDEYLACDGTIYNIADYDDLADFFEAQFGTKNHFGGDGTTTFAVPDLRGEFLRGTGTNSHTNQGSGANVGEHQDSTAIDINVSNAGRIQVVGADSSYNTGNPRTWYENQNLNDGNNRTIRPTNTSVLYCIKYTKESYELQNVYSTTEQRIGTWIDGKPLYRKVFENPVSPISSGLYDTLYSIKKIQGFALNQYGDYINLPHADIRNYAAGIWLTKSTGIIEFRVSVGVMTVIYVLVEYTKTTD